MLQKEREERIRRDREDDEKFVQQTMKLHVDEDESYLKYAAEIIEEATKKGRYLYPILQASVVATGLRTRRCH
jgi:hypothetical protein